MVHPAGPRAGSEPYPTDSLTLSQEQPLSSRSAHILEFGMKAQRQPEVTGEQEVDILQ